MSVVIDTIELMGLVTETRLSSLTLLKHDKGLISSDMCVEITGLIFALSLHLQKHLPL